MDEVLKVINRAYILLPEEEVRKNKMILESVLTEIVYKMRSKDLLFDKMYRRVFYGGSFYDGLRIGTPTEFDLDLLLDIPKFAKPEIIESNIPGYVYLQAKDIQAWMRQPEGSEYKKIDELLFDEDFFLSSEKTSKWVHSIISRTLNDYQYDSVAKAYIFSNYHGTFQIKCFKSGPAWTLNIVGRTVEMDVDLVVCFVFGEKKLPWEFRGSPFLSENGEFFIVPKQPKNSDDPLCWRLSFQEQERALLKGKNPLKSSIKLLKKMRDTLGHDNIASYHIKTVGLYMAESEDFWHRPLSQVFMTLLKNYRDFMRDKEIPFFWSRHNNLLSDIKSPMTLENYANRLTAVIKDIEKHPDNLEVVDKYFCNKKNTQVKQFDQIWFLMLMLSCVIFFPFSTQRVNCESHE